MVNCYNTFVARLPSAENAGAMIIQCFYRDVLKCFKTRTVIKHLWPHKLVVHYQ
jgi:hypothetical protein